MTREEKVNLLNELLEIEEKNDIGNLTSMDRREFQQWVEGLEHNLDKIKEEIEQLPSELTADGRRMIRRGDVFRVFYKYKAESEEK